MAQAPASGAFSYCNYGFETIYGTVATSFPRPFGHGVKLSLARKNNMEAIVGLGARNAVANVAKKYEGIATIEFLLGAGETTIAHGGASWFRAVLGAIPTDGGAEPFTHSYAENNSLTPFSMEAGIELGTLDYVATIIGCKVQTCTITAAVNEVVKVKLECPYMTETYATSSLSAQVAPTEVPMTFAQGTLEVDDTTVGFVQSIELTINNNVEMIWGCGSRYATAGPEKTRKYDVKMNVAFSNAALLLEHFFGKAASVDADDLKVLNPAGVAMVLTFSNGLATTYTRSIVLTFADLQLDADTLPLDVNEVTKEDVTGWTLSCTSIVVSNMTETDVAST